MTEQTEKMYEPVDLHALAVLIWRNLWKIILIAAIVGILVYTLLPQYEEVTYSAQAELVVPDRFANDGEPIATNVSTCAAIAKNSAVLNGVISELKLNILPDQLDAMISVDVVKDSAILRLTVLSDNRSLSKNIMEALIPTAQKQISEVVDVSCSQADDVTITVQKTSSNLMKKTCLAMAAALLAGMLFFICHELFDRSVKDKETAEACTGLPVLGVIPRSKRSAKTAPADASALEPDRREAYRMLRTNLLHKTAPDGIKSIVVTSSVPDEGVYGAAVNVALSLSALGKKTALMDCNLRNGELASYLGVKADAGLAELLSETAGIDDCAVQIGGGLKAIVSGQRSAQAAELLSGDKMRGLIEKLESEYDFVILIAPAAAVVTDAAVLGAAAGGVLLTVRARFAKTETIQLAGERLALVGANVLGTVITRFDKRKVYSHSGYASVLRKKYREI